MQAQWEERLAAYVATSFDAGILGSLGQNAIQYVSKADDRADPVVRRASGDRGRDDGRRADRLQHDRRARWCSRSCGCRSCGRISSRCRCRSRGSATSSTRRRSRRRSNLLTLPPPRGAIELRGVTLALSPRRAGRAAQRLAGDRAGRGDRRRRPLGLRQVDPDQARSSASTARRPAR